MSNESQDVVETTPDVAAPADSTSDDRSGEGADGQATQAAADVRDEVTVAAGSTDTSLNREGSGETDDGPAESGEADGDGSAPGVPDGRSALRAQLEEEGDIAADYLETLLDIADLDGDLEVDIEKDRAAVSIVDSEDGPVSQALVGRSAEVLDALQELTRLAVQASTGERSRLMLDIAEHRADRKAALAELARQTAEEVRSTGAPQELDPMTAFERKVVHDAVLAAGLSSHSEGEEPNRYVVVVPAS